MRTIALFTFAIAILVQSVTVRAECTCVGELIEEFGDGSLAPRWVTGTVACGAITEVGGVLSLARGSCVGTMTLSMDKTRETVCGDFDLFVDYSLTGFTVPTSGSRWASVGVRTTDNAHQAVLERYNRFAPEACTPATTNYKLYVDNTNNCASTIVPTSDQAGRFRLRRTGTSIEFYVWNGSWVLLATRTFTSGDVYVVFYSGTDASTTAFTAAFDNLTINSIECPVPVKETTWGKVKSLYHD